MWQVCRYDEQEVVDRTGPTKVLPDAATARWMSIAVPGNKFEVKPELRFCHRMVYRTRVDVPAGLRRPVVLPAVPVAEHDRQRPRERPVLRLDQGAFRAMGLRRDAGRSRPGQVNEICVVIKDTYYAFSEKKTGKSCRLSFNMPVAWMGAQNWVCAVL